MVMASSLTSTKQNPQWIFSTMWNASSNVAWPSCLMMSWSYAILCTSLSCLDIYNCTNLYHFMKTSPLSLANLCQFHVHGKWSMIFFPFGDLGSFALDLCECSHTPIPKARNLIQAIKWWWVPNVCNGTQCCSRNSWHKICGIWWVHMNTTHRPMVEECSKSCREVVLGWLGFGPQHYCPFLESFHDTITKCVLNHCAFHPFWSGSPQNH